MKLITSVLAIFTVHMTLAQPIVVAEGTLKVSGLSEDNHFYGLAEGDEVTISIEEQSGKAIREIEWTEYPNTSRFIEFKKSEVNKRLIIPKTGIYQLSIVNGAIGGRICQYKIERIPASQETSSFNTNVYWETKTDTIWEERSETYLARDEYVPKSIVPNSNFFINSGSNAMFKGGSSRISIPLNFPENTIKWFYEFSASREPKEIEHVQENFQLMTQLTSSIEPTMAIANIGISLLNAPPGGDICDVYLMDHENSSLFTSKEEFRYYSDGSRENLKSGIVEVSWILENLVLGVKNPSATYGIHVSVEVVAIVHELEYKEREVIEPKLHTYNIPYLKN